MCNLRSRFVLYETPRALAIGVPLDSCISSIGKRAVSSLNWGTTSWGPRLCLAKRWPH